MIGTLATFFLSALPLGPAGGPQPRDKEPPQEAPGALGRALAVAPATWYWIGRDELGWVRMRAHRDALTAARVVAVYDALTAAQAGRLKCVEAPFGIRLANPGRETLAALADATGLQYLVLDFDECPDWLTEVLASFSRLAYLELRLSEPGKCPDGLLAAVAGMDGLTHLSLSGVNVGSQQGMEAFFRMPLESLALSYCTGLSVVFNERLADMPRLRSVEVHGTRISGRTTRAIATCPRVDAVCLRDCTLTGHALGPLTAMTGMATLDLQGVKTDDPADFGAVAGFRYLHRLNLRETKANDALVENLDGSRLEVLFLSGEGITNRSATPLVKMKRLEHLDLTATAIGDDGVRRLVAGLVLTRLGLAGTAVTDRVVPALQERPTASLELAGTRVTAAGLARLAASSAITELGISSESARGADLERIRKARAGLRLVVSE